MKETTTASPPPKAVALQWDRAGAPRVTAAGAGATAERILEIAQEYDIPLQPDPVLVDALSQIPIGDEIPRALYVAVAEILAFVFMLEGIDPRPPRLYPAETDVNRE